MKSVLDFMKHRRSALAMTMDGDGPSQAEIIEMIEVASRVPDHGKLAPWRFIQYSKKDRQHIDFMFRSRIFSAKNHPDFVKWEKELSRFTNVPLVIGVVSSAIDHPKIPQWEQVLSGGAAAMNLVIAANAMGFEAQWLTGWYTYDRDALDVLGVKESENVIGMIHIGRSSTPKSERPRPDIDAVLTGWSQPNQ